jgi:hypothetical protein
VTEAARAILSSACADGRRTPRGSGPPAGRRPARFRIDPGSGA